MWRIDLRKNAGPLLLFLSLLLKYLGFESLFLSLSWSSPSWRDGGANGFFLLLFLFFFFLLPLFIKLKPKTRGWEWGGDKRKRRGGNLTLRKSGRALISSCCGWTTDLCWCKSPDRFVVIVVFFPQVLCPCLVHIVKPYYNSSKRTCWKRFLCKSYPPYL